MNGLSAERTKGGRLQREALRVLLEHEADGTIPTNIRFVFYELEQAGVVTKNHPKGRRHDGQNLSDAILRLREVGLVPWEWIEDETRSISIWSHSPTGRDYLLDKARSIRLNPWGDEDPPLLLVESRSLAGVLRNLAYAYTVDIAGTNGQVGGFLHTDVLSPYRESHRVLYLGDLDLAGDQIEANTRRVLEREGGEAVMWERVAITLSQAATLAGRGMTPIVKQDHRYNGGLEHEAWETEALGQRVIVDLVRGQLDRLLPEPLEDVRVRETGERERAVSRLRRWK